MGSQITEFDLWSNYLNSIDGKLVGTGETRHGINPATGEANPEVPVSTQQDVNAAVDAGLKAFRTWSKTSWDERKRCVLAYADALEKLAPEFARLLTMEQGKPVCSILVGATAY
jgi:acyl-CoA reductase-like NAD-dependent aldehyde dehydrogenase